MDDLDPVTGAQPRRPYGMPEGRPSSRRQADLPGAGAADHPRQRASAWHPLQRVRLTRSTLSDMLLGRKFPSKAFLLTFVEACGIDLEADRRWEQAWDRLASRYHQVPPLSEEMERLRQENEKLRQGLTALKLATSSVAPTVAPAPDKTLASLQDGRAQSGAAETAKKYFDEFDPTLYGIPATCDDQGNHEYPKGFDPATGEWLEGHEQERDEWDKQYVAARARFDTHRRLFSITGYDLAVTVPVTFTELILGTKVQVWPLRRSQPITIKLTPGMTNGKTLRINGLGAPRPGESTSGDLLVTLDAQIPSPGDLDSTVLRLIERLQAVYNGDEMRTEFFGLPVAGHEQTADRLPGHGQERAAATATPQGPDPGQARILTDAVRAAWSINGEEEKAYALAKAAEAVAASDRADRLITDAERIAKAITREVESTYPHRGGGSGGGGRPRTRRAAHRRRRAPRPGNHRRVFKGLGPGRGRKRSGGARPNRTAPRVSPSGSLANTPRHMPWLPSQRQWRRATRTA